MSPTIKLPQSNNMNDFRVLRKMNEKEYMSPVDVAIKSSITFTEATQALHFLYDAGLVDRNDDDTMISYRKKRR